MTPIKLLGLVGSLLYVTACTTNVSHSYKIPEAPAHSADNFYQPNVSKMSIKAYTYMLADELLVDVEPSMLSGNIAVTQFVCQSSRQIDLVSGDPLNQLGGQLEEGFVYELNKRGFSVVDFKMMDVIRMTEQGEEVWSRKSELLPRSIEARYVLSGTYSEHEKGAIVNVKLVNFNNKSVVAAAQGFVPANSFWADESVSLRDGFLTHKGEKRRVF
jgi:TolB-like protein